MNSFFVKILKNPPIMLRRCGTKEIYLYLKGIKNVTNGLVIGKEVIVRYEAQGISLDIRVIKNLVKQII